MAKELAALKLDVIPQYNVPFRPLGIEECLGKRALLDFALPQQGKLVVIELDEHQHKWYALDSETTRVERTHAVTTLKAYDLFEDGLWQSPPQSAATAGQAGPSSASGKAKASFRPPNSPPQKLQKLAWQVKQPKLGPKQQGLSKFLARPASEGDAHSAEPTPATASGAAGPSQPPALPVFEPRKPSHSSTPRSGH